MPDQVGHDGGVSGMTRSCAALRMTGRAELGRDAAGQSGQGLAPEDVSTPGLGQGEGPEWRAPRATGTEFLRSQLHAAPGGKGKGEEIPGQSFGRLRNRPE